MESFLYCLSYSDLAIHKVVDVPDRPLWSYNRCFSLVLRDGAISKNSTLCQSKVKFYELKWIDMNLSIHEYCSYTKKLATLGFYV